MGRAIWAAAAVCAAMLSSAAPASAQEEEIEALPMRYPPSSVRPKLIVGGLTLTGLAYAAAALSGTQWDDVPGADALRVPVVGPWIAFVQNDCAPDDPDCDVILVVRGILTVLDGLIQAGGLGIAGEGLFMTTEADAPAKDEADTGLQILPTPIITESGGGIGITAQF